MFKSIYLISLFIFIVLCDAEMKQDVWEQDLSDAFKIDASTDGLQKVHLKCGSNSMHVELETDEDFNGVMYTRGSFYKQTEPCFVKPNLRKGGRSLAMNFALNQCQTLQDGEVYSNVVVVQHDPDLVTPGDAAFVLECDFRQPRDINVAADMQARERQAVSSRIILTSPDPSATVASRNDIEDDNNSLKRPTSAFNESDVVTFVPSPYKNVVKKVKGSVETVKLEQL